MSPLSLSLLATFANAFSSLSALDFVCQYCNRKECGINSPERPIARCGWYAGRHLHNGQKRVKPFESLSFHRYTQHWQAQFEPRPCRANAQPTGSGDDDLQAVRFCSKGEFRISSGVRWAETILHSCATSEFFRVSAACRIVSQSDLPSHDYGNQRFSSHHKPPFLLPSRKPGASGPRCPSTRQKLRLLDDQDVSPGSIELAQIPVKCMGVMTGETCGSYPITMEYWGLP